MLFLNMVCLIVALASRRVKSGVILCHAFNVAGNRTSHVTYRMAAEDDVGIEIER
jgi:hypothetical protein